MSIDFFETDCKEAARTDRLFGICDDEDGNPAYTDIIDTDNWVATIKNESEMAVSFTAIDNCLPILKEDTNDLESSCDGMLTFEDRLYLVELKNAGTGGWISGAMDQLENTMKLLLARHSIETFRYKKAFACNKKHPRFTVIDHERKRRFFRNYGFRVDVQAEIVIK